MLIPLQIPYTQVNNIVHFYPYPIITSGICQQWNKNYFLPKKIPPWGGWEVSTGVKLVVSVIATSYNPLVFAPLPEDDTPEFKPVLGTVFCLAILLSALYLRSLILRALA